MAEKKRQASVQLMQLVASGMSMKDAKAKLGAAAYADEPATDEAEGQNVDPKLEPTGSDGPGFDPQQDSDDDEETPSDVQRYLDALSDEDLVDLHVQAFEKEPAANIKRETLIDKLLPVVKLEG